MLRARLQRGRGFIIAGLMLALAVVIASAAPSRPAAGPSVSASTSPDVLPYFGLLPSIAYDPNRRQIMLFNNRGETWLWAQNRWRQAHPAVSPSGRIGAVAAWDPLMGALLLVGGQSSADETVLHDTWSWNGSTWKTLGTRTTALPGDFMLALTYDSDLEQMVLVGSDLRYGLPIHVWTWDGASWHARDSSGAPVSPVAVAAYDPVTETVLAVSARCSHTDCVSQTWSWNGASWQQLEPAHEPGFSFSNMVLVPDPTSGRLVLLTVAPRPIGPTPTETWTWDGRDWNPRGTIGERGATVVAASGDGVQAKILAFQDIARGFKTVRIDTWIWADRSWTRIGGGLALG
jgi:hypothetical protein